MVLFFTDQKKTKSSFYAVSACKPLDSKAIQKLEWLLDCKLSHQQKIVGDFIGPITTMVSPWSSNAVDITKSMGIDGIKRIEMYYPLSSRANYDRMLEEKHSVLKQTIFDTHQTPEVSILIEDLEQYNKKEGLALSSHEMEYLKELSIKYKRNLTDTEVFGFSQVNSEHCRHKIFNGIFIIDGKEQSESLFELIKKTSKTNPNEIVSAYSDNVAFIEGPLIHEFTPQFDKAQSVYQCKTVDSVLSIKAETHNFPTTVEPFNGAATGSGGEIRDRMAGGQGSIPLAGTAVYMTPYSRISHRPWENNIDERKWLYQRPLDILIKASNGASDFGNKFGQPLICGSLLTFEHQQENKTWSYDKTIMLAGGVGYGYRSQALKKKAQAGDLVLLLGGDNYRIGMGGAAVSSLDTGLTDQTLELNAVQRSNPEMQKRVANTIRILVERASNPIVSIHDHGAGGHLNCFTELMSETGGTIDIDCLPIGDPTLSAKEILGNESQERMGLIIAARDLPLVQSIASRERCPCYVVGEISDDHRLLFQSKKEDQTVFDLTTKELFSGTPKTVLRDVTTKPKFKKIFYDPSNIHEYLKNVLSLESVSCKDWLTNKVDRCVGGRVAKQPTVGELQLPLNNCGVIALDYSSHKGIATAIGHAPMAGLIDATIGSELAITESLTNLVWAPLEKGLTSVSLSANWMWPCNHPNENARLYEAVQAASDFAMELGINIPTGKDSLSMIQEYPEKKVIAPGTVIISAVGQCNAITQIVEPVLKLDGGDLYYIDISQNPKNLGGSAFAQTLNFIGTNPPKVSSAAYLKTVFDAVQQLIKTHQIVAGHDVSSGGLITSLLEMCFPSCGIGLDINVSSLESRDIISLLFSENPGLLIQSKHPIDSMLKKQKITCKKLGRVISAPQLNIKFHEKQYPFDINRLRRVWYEPSYQLDKHQTIESQATKRKQNIDQYPLNFKFPHHFSGLIETVKTPRKFKAAVLREQGSNSEREMAYALHLAGFEVLDVHMTDLIEGRIDFQDVHFLAAVGGFSYSDVLGSAKGWAGSFLYNAKAKKTLDAFYTRSNTLSLGVCNGCQLFMELNLIHLQHHEKPKMQFNESGKFECQFTSVDILDSPSIMFQGLEGSRLGIWAAHGEGRFYLPENESHYPIVGKYFVHQYPRNPNGSDYNTAMLCSDDGRHLATMPHLERSTFPWNWPYYPNDRKTDKVSPWMMAFQNAYRWLLIHG